MPLADDTVALVQPIFIIELPVRRDKPARRRRWKSSTPKG
jgi:hypothetical protein